MNKSIDYYLSLPYTIEVIPDEEDGGYVARIRELPGCLTQAETWEELLEMIEDANIIAQVSRGLGEAMVGINVSTMPEGDKIAQRGW